jgi:hypothetical protein
MGGDIWGWDEIFGLKRIYKVQILQSSGKEISVFDIFIYINQVICRYNKTGLQF